MLEDNLEESCFSDNLDVTSWTDNILQTLSCSAPEPSATASLLVFGYFFG